MITSNIDFLKAAVSTLDQSGNPGSTMDTLMQQTEIAGKKLPKETGSENELLELLLLGLEQEASVPATANDRQKTAPDEETCPLFNGLHKLFEHEQWYLELAFEPVLQLSYTKAEAFISRTKKLPQHYLTPLMKKGKAEDEFATTESTLSLVNEIPGSFQATINDRQLTFKMIKDIKFARAKKAHAIAG